MPGFWATLENMTLIVVVVVVVGTVTKGECPTESCVKIIHPSIEKRVVSDRPFDVCLEKQLDIGHRRSESIKCNMANSGSFDFVWN